MSINLPEKHDAAGTTQNASRKEFYVYLTIKLRVGCM
jgi:hypothetical protein